MNILKSKVAIVLLGFVMLEACAKVPITGRRQLNLVSEGEMMAMANTQYAGFLVVYTGILPVTQNDNGLAVVMGHEIAHAIARHGNERMSQAVTAQGLGTVLSVANDENPTLVGNIFLQSYGIGSQLGLLAYGRKQESEADKMGLVFMAMAGYDPREAPIFWERMSAGGGAAPPEILSTHPSDERRVADLNAYMDEALKYYKP